MYRIKIEKVGLEGIYPVVEINEADGYLLLSFTPLGCVLDAADITTDEVAASIACDETLITAASLALKAKSLLDSKEVELDAGV